eukprot:TRINITY_DN18559_c0_g1_i2.p1 TRINITY_DN18559_c0_g1~~TRINITY_DN18559_c0_g1_i2.p1  ORF type:complete len:382 (+),score=67.16 TRINITY_DN18559_c0_g1_i2:483-1628(+)
MILETWVMPLALGGGKGNPLGDIAILRLLRLLRLSRLARLLRSIPELVILVKGIVAATRSVATVLLMLCILCYIWAIIFTGTYKHYPKDEEEGLHFYFGSIGMSMFTFICNGTLLDNLADLVLAIKDDSLIMLALFLAFILLSAFTMLNMLIGILCDVVAQTEKEETERQALEIIKAAFLEAFRTIDTDGSGRVSGTEFDAMLSDGSEVLLLVTEEFGLDKQGLQEIKALMFPDEDRELSFDEFMRLLIRFRPSEKAGSMDVQQLLKMLGDQERQVAIRTDEVRSEFLRVCHLHLDKLGVPRHPGAEEDSEVTISKYPQSRFADTLSARAYMAVPSRVELEELCEQASVSEIVEELQHRADLGEAADVTSCLPVPLLSPRR